MFKQYHPLICSCCGRKCGLIKVPTKFICTICLTDSRMMILGMQDKDTNRVQEEISLAGLATQFKHSEYDVIEDGTRYGSLPMISYWVLRLKESLTKG